MADLTPAAQPARLTPLSPTGPARAPVADPVPVPLPVPRMPGADRSRLTAQADPLAAAPRGVDLAELARTAGLLGQALQRSTDVVDAGASAADAVAYAPDAIREAFARIGKMAPPDATEKLAKAVDHANQASRVLGVVGAAIAAKDLFDACWPQLNLSGAGEALSNFALGLATAGDSLFVSAATNGLIKSVGGIAGIASSLFWLAREIKDWKENGVGFGNVAGMLAAAVSGAGSAMLLIPGMEALGGALLMASASLNLIRLAVENWDGIKGRAQAVTGRVGDWLAQATQPATGPPRVSIIPP